MDVKVLKTFIAVAENRHFGRAAEQLYITQAAVSARIKLLEEFYASTLFIRDKNNLTLTPAGEALMPFVHLIIEQIEQSKEVVQTANQQKTSFNLAATPNVWDAFLSKRVHDINNLFEHWVVSTEISVREAIQRKLDEKTLNIAFLTDPLKEADFVNILIGYFDIVLVGDKPNLTEPCPNYIYVDWGLTFAKEHAKHHKVAPMHKTSTAMIALELMLTKGGCAYLPYQLVANHLKHKQLFTISSPIQIKRPIYLVHRQGVSNVNTIHAVENLFNFTNGTN